MKGDDPNYFVSNYFSGQKWDNPDLVRSEESYQLTRKVIEADDRSIVDATLNGAYTVFDKQRYTQVFQNDF